MVRILLVDDDADLAAMLAAYFAGEGIEMHSLSNGEETLSAIQSGQYDAVLLDVMMPRLSGIDVLRHLRRFSQIPVLMLTAKSDGIDRVVGLEVGADDYICKPFHAPELLARLKAVLRRAAAGSVLPPKDLVMVPQRRSVVWRGQPLVLTMSELRLLELLVWAAGSFVSKSSMSETVLGRSHKSHDRTVDAHISRLRRRLASLTNGELGIRSVRGVGYALESTK